MPLDEGICREIGLRNLKSIDMYEKKRRSNWRIDLLILPYSQNAPRSFSLRKVK